MTQFSNKFKKPCFWPIFGPFSSFLGQKNFPGKSDSVTHNFIWVSSTMPILEKVNDTIQRKWEDRRKDRQKDWRKDGWTDSGYRQGSNNNKTKIKHTTLCNEYDHGVLKMLIYHQKLSTCYALRYTNCLILLIAWNLYPQN